jgi:hypothetical protein
MTRAGMTKGDAAEAIVKLFDAMRHGNEEGVEAAVKYITESRDVDLNETIELNF